MRDPLRARRPPPQRLDAETNGDRAVVANRSAHILQRLEPEARAVLERAAVLVGAAVVERRQKLERQVAMPAVDVDDVEPCVARKPCGLHPVAPHTVDVFLLHRLRHAQRLVVARELRRPDRRRPRLAGACMHSSWVSSMPASAPCSWASSHMSDRLRASSSSHTRTETIGQ